MRRRPDDFVWDNDADDALAGAATVATASPRLRGYFGLSLLERARRGLAA